MGDSTAMLLNHDTKRPYLTLPQCPECLTWNTSEFNVTTSTMPLGYFSSSHHLPRQDTKQTERICSSSGFQDSRCYKGRGEPFILPSYLRVAANQGRKVQPSPRAPGRAVLSLLKGGELAQEREKTDLCLTWCTKG